MAISRVRPDNVWVGEKGAFRLDRAGLDRFIAMAREYVGASAPAKFTLALRDGSKIVAENIEDLDHFEFHLRKRIENFDIEVSDWEEHKLKYISLRFDLGRFADQCRIYISGIEEILSAERASKAFLEGIRPWYSWIYRAHLLVLVTINMIVEVVYFISKWNQSSILLHNVFGFLEVSFVAYIITVVGARLFLFTRVDLEFGEEMRHQAHLMNARRAVFGVLGVALLVALVGGLSSGYFTGLFAHVADHH